MKRQLTKEELARLFKRQAENRVELRKRVINKYTERFNKIVQLAEEKGLLKGDYRNRILGIYKMSYDLCGCNFMDFVEFSDFVLSKPETTHWIKQGSGVSTGNLLSYATQVYLIETERIKKLMKVQAEEEQRERRLAI